MSSHFIQNLIPRLKKFASNIEIKEALVDKVWVIYGDQDLIEYEFERPSSALDQSGEITVSKNGNSYDGSWKILGSGRLKIRTDFANNILDYDFSIPGILVMKVAGNQNTPFLLFNPKIIQNGNIEAYLDHLEATNKDKQLPTPDPDFNTTIPEETIVVFWVIVGLVVFGLLISLAS